MTEKVEEGQVAFLRTTSEPVFVLKLATKQGEQGLYAQVRRPVETKNGLEHRVEEFKVEELETRSSRVAHDMQEITAILGAGKQGAQPTTKAEEN